MKMSGTLELLCGPSGVGKTSGLGGAIKSYRWTTRRKRDYEIDSRKYDGTKSTHGFFVTQKKFLEKKDELVGVHRYPCPKKGFWYGFPKKEMIEALEKGEKLSEQIVTFDVIDDIITEFQEYGKTEKILVLGFYFDIASRLSSRVSEKNKNIIKKRFDKTKDDLMQYLKNIFSFDKVFFNTANEIRGDDEKTISKLAEILKIDPKIVSKESFFLFTYEDSLENITDEKLENPYELYTIERILNYTIYSDYILGLNLQKYNLNHLFLPSLAAHVAYELQQEELYYNILFGFMDQLERYKKGEIKTHYQKSLDFYFHISDKLDNYLTERKISKPLNVGETLLCLAELTLLEFLGDFESIIYKSKNFLKKDLFGKDLIEEFKTSALHCFDKKVKIKFFNFEENETYMLEEISKRRFNKPTKEFDFPQDDDPLDFVRKLLIPDMLK